MRILSYSPSVEVYAAVREKDGDRYVDLTPDVVQCQVTRKSDAASTFSVRLQNVGNKYNGFFAPMDRVSINCTKLDAVKLLTGYITDVPAFTVYGADVTISGCCPIYRLEKLFWDPQLFASMELMGYDAAYKDWGDVLSNLLVKAGGYSPEQVFIGDIPDEAFDFAYGMYKENSESAGQLKSMANEFYEVLKTHGPKIVSNPTVSGGGGGALMEGVSFNMSESAFVKLWGERIDNYLSMKAPGSPLIGHGATYARAAYRAKFDPRFLVAVAGAEQSFGLVESGMNGNYYGWAVYDSGAGALAWNGASGIDAWIEYLLSDRAILGSKPIYQYTSLEEIDAVPWATARTWIDHVRQFMSEI